MSLFILLSTISQKFKDLSWTRSKNTEKRRVIILEGPDGAGKTTLANRLRDDLSAFVFHPGGPPKSWLELWNRYDRIDQIVETRLKDGYDFVILDRHPAISDPVYRTVEGKFPRYIPQYKLEGLKPIIVLCMSDMDKMFESIDPREKPHKTLAQMMFVKARYGSIVAEYERRAWLGLFGDPKKVKLVTYDRFEDSYDDLLRELKQ